MAIDRDQPNQLAVVRFGPPTQTCLVNCRWTRSPNHPFVEINMVCTASRMSSVSQALRCPANTPARKPASSRPETLRSAPGACRSSQETTCRFSGRPRRRARRRAAAKRSHATQRSDSAAARPLCSQTRAPRVPPCARPRPPSREPAATPQIRARRTPPCTTPGRPSPALSATPRSAARSPGPAASPARATRARSPSAKAPATSTPSAIAASSPARTSSPPWPTRASSTGPRSRRRARRTRVGSRIPTANLAPRPSS
mmetsp:Transcript_33244/g.69619  ORF Transcript_33244/g.69619 Transcript_33244/m.69619 type:complete len:257 (-) Transcript_33244:125-895(-)